MFYLKNRPNAADAILGTPAIASPGCALVGPNFDLPSYGPVGSRKYQRLSKRNAFQIASSVLDNVFLSLLSVSERVDDNRHEYHEPTNHLDHVGRNTQHLQTNLHRL